MLNERPLGKTELDVSEISLGAWQIGGRGYGPVSKADADATIKAYLEAGGNFIDTARRYGNSEARLGDYFRRNGGRQEVIIASKTHRLAPKAIRQELEESLRRLETDYIDLYYLHAPPDDPDEMHRVLDTYETLKQEGKIRAIGASIKGPDVTKATVDLCRQYIDTGRVDVLMVIYSIFRQKNADIFAEAAANGVGIVARTVLESGFLTGKYELGHEFDAEDDHRVRWGQERVDRILAEGRRLGRWAIAQPYDSLAQVAIRFALDSEEISSVVVGARTAEQIKESLQAASLPPLSTNLRQRLIKTFRGQSESFNTGT
jgi:aryl-alcohol dehydrogenase-like predicted oxidoreductase